MRKSLLFFAFVFLVFLGGCAPLCSGNRSEIKAPHTGLIVDTRGTGLQPSMHPKIVKEGDSKVVYEMCDRETGRQMGIVAYSYSIKEAADKAQSGENPLVVRAIGTDTTLKSVMITSRDAALVAQADQQNQFLKKCAVVIVLDRGKK